jgi:hypothetical protein
MQFLFANYCEFIGALTSAQIAQVYIELQALRHEQYLAAVEKADGYLNLKISEDEIVTFYVQHLGERYVLIAYEYFTTSKHYLP